MVDVLSIIAIISGLIGVISALTIHLRSNCFNSFCSFDVISDEEYKTEQLNKK